MRRVLHFGALYFLIVFAAGFAFGAIRVSFVAPALGPLVAVLMELPFILATSWWVAGWLLERIELKQDRGEAVLAGVLAFALLMAAEASLATALGGLTLAGFFSHMASPDGLLGLAGQIAFAVIPAIRSRLTER